jgi:hypothetical protein
MVLPGWFAAVAVGVLLLWLARRLSCPTGSQIDPKAPATKVLLILLLFAAGVVLLSYGVYHVASALWNH